MCWFLLAAAAPDEQPCGEVELFSAPGEGREAVEIARRVLREARRGVPFDRMAIALRSPQHYAGLLEHALERAGVPAYFERGTRRPHPAGRAFLALVACALDNLSARRFAEYLSLGAGAREAGGRDRPPRRSRRRATKCSASLASAPSSEAQARRGRRRPRRQARAPGLSRAVEVGAAAGRVARRRERASAGNAG